MGHGIAQVLATNTSVMKVGDVAAKASGRSRIIGTHWWNPPFLVPLVEVVQGGESDPAVIERAITLLKALGKTPVHVKRDVAGFVGNRLQHALWREAFDLVDKGVCDPADTRDPRVRAPGPPPALAALTRSARACGARGARDEVRLRVPQLVVRGSHRNAAPGVGAPRGGGPTKGVTV